MHRTLILDGSSKRSVQIGVLSYCLMLLLLLQVACQPDTDTISSRKTTEPPSIVAINPILDSINTPTPKLITPSPQPSPTLQPSPTPKITISVTGPDRWAELLAQTLAKLNTQDSKWIWQVGENDPNISIVKGEQDQYFTSTATALTVDFTSILESVTLEEASSMLSLGDDRVIAMEWAQVPPDRKTLKIDGLMPDESGYALQQTWSVASKPEFYEPATELVSALKLGHQVENTMKLSAVGDLMLDRALGYAIRQGDIGYPFSLVSNTLSLADITIGNLESALGSSGEPVNKSYTFQAPPAAAESLSLAGFDIVSLANNHAMDYGEASLLEGINLLNNQGIHAIGAGINSSSARTPVILEEDGLRTAFLGYVNVPIEVSGFDTKKWEATEESPGLAWANLDDIDQDVSVATQNADLVIVVLHSGYEYLEAPSQPQVEAARVAIDAGADLVIGHHAHILQGIEFYNGGVIAYGLGNFAFEIDGDPSTAILNVWLDSNGVREVQILPAIIQFGGQTRMASIGEAASIKQRVYYLSDLLNNQ